MKELHGLYFDGITFGTDIEIGEAYNFFKKNLGKEKCIGGMGQQLEVITVPAVALAALLGTVLPNGHARWLVMELHSIDWVQIDGLRNDNRIYIKYDDEQIDFRTRATKYSKWGAL